MQQFSIKNSGDFVRSLLMGNKFDNWQLVLAKIQKSNTFDIDGQLLDEDDNQTHIKWEKIKNVILEIIKGKNKPKFMKIILKENELHRDDDTYIYILDINYTDSMIIKTGITYKTFTLDKEVIKKWDLQVINLLEELKVDYTIIE